MKTRFKRFGKSSLSLMLSLVMIVSTVLVGSLVSADADSSNEISAADVVEDVAATVDSDLVDSNSLDSVEDTAVANDNLADVSKSISLTDDKSVETLQTTETKLEVSTVSDKKTEKSVPESSGDADPSVASGYKRVYFYNNQCWSTVNAYIWKNGVDNSAPVTYPGNAELLKESVQYADTYFIDIDTSQYDRIIFNNGNNRNKTGDINISNVDSTKAYCYYIQGGTSNNTIDLSKISDNTDPYVIYFKKYSSWNADYLHANFDSTSGHKTTWTGRSMSWLSDDLYYIVLRNIDYDLSNSSNHSDAMTVTFNAWETATTNKEKLQADDVMYNRNTYANTVFSCPGDLTHVTSGKRTVNNNKYYLQYGDASHNFPLTFNENIPVTLDIVNNQLVNYVDFNVSSLSLVKSSNYFFALATASSGESNIVNTDSNITVNKTGSAINAGAESNNDGRVHKYARFSYNSDNVTNVRVYVNNLSGTNYTVSGPDATISSKTAHIYAKTGTIRDDGGDYNKYSKIAEKVEIINSSGESIGSNDKGYTDIYDHHTYYRLKTATVNKGDTIKIRITIKDRYKGLYYVKGFCVNGFSEGILENVPDTNQNVYELTYKVPNNLDTNYVEITPVYYYFEESGQTYVTFSAEDFDDPSIQGMWGNTLACYAWYTGSLGDHTSDYKYSSEYDITKNQIDAAKEKDALGGYPGQPMLYDGGAYYMQVPKYVGVNHDHVIEGVTLNNYYWDDVHRSIHNGEFLGQNNTFKQSNGSSDKNCQTYDYDDFLALMNLNVKKIVFSFKYRTYQSDDKSYDSGNLKNIDTSTTAYFKGNNINFSYVDSTVLNQDGSINTYSTGNGWDVLVDYTDIPIDLFGRRIENTLTEDCLDNNNETVLSKDADYLNDKYVLNYFDEAISNDDPDKYDKTKIYIVSNGYEHYYDTDSATIKYIGKYATKWYVYTKKSNGSYKFIGALPSSAFLTGLNSEKNGVDKNNYLNYSDDALSYKAYEDGLKDEDENNVISWDTYQTIYNECAGRPVVISYESAIFDKGAAGVTSNYGYRCDGRWYYSFGNEPIYANILIQYANRDAEGNLPTDGYGKTAYTTDAIKAGTVNQGNITNAKAYFTNEGHEGTIHMDTVVNDEDRYRFITTSSRVTGSNGKTYKFVGWYSNSGSNVVSRVKSGSEALSTQGDKPMDSIMTFIARFEEVENTNENTLNVSHILYSNETVSATDPVIHNGTGNTYVQIQVFASDDTNEENVLYNSFTQPSGADVPSEYLDSATNNKIKITLTTTANEGTSLYDIYYKNDSNSNNIYYSKTGLNLSNSQTNSTTSGLDSTESSLSTKTVVYEYNVGDLFTTGESKQITLNFSSDLTVVKNVNIAFKYYDRKQANNSAAIIDTSAKELDFTVNLDGTKTITDAVVEVVKNESGGAMQCIDNILNEYYFWPTQAEAVGSNGIKGQAHYRTDVTGNTSYADAGLTGVDYQYHTDAYGRLYGEEKYAPVPNNSSAALEQWVSYNNGAVSESTALNDPSTVTSVVVWAYNTPKTYVVDVYAPTEDNQVLTNHTTAKLLDSTEDVYYDLSNSNPQKGFYNQRLGEVDTDESGKEWGSNEAVDYLRTYGIEKVFLGDKIETQSSAKVAKTAEEKANDSENGDESDYYELTFSGWYAYTDKRDSDNKIIEGSEELVKVTTNSNYGYRITKDMKLVAGYVKTPVSKVGVSLTDNGIDYYLDESNKDVELRFNTQLNVYGTSEPDTSITKVSAIYVQLPSTYEVNSETKVFTADDITPELLADIESRIKLNNYSKLDGAERRVINIRNLKLNDDVNVDGKITRFTYDTQGTNALTLTNKNRVQFVLPMTEVQFNGDGENVGQFSAFLVYGAIYRDGGWILSDNYIPYISNSNSNSNSNVNGIQPSTASVEEFIFSVEEDVTDEDTVVLYGGLGD